MSADQISLPISQRETFLSTRLLGTLGMIASPLLFAEVMLSGQGDGQSLNARLLPLLGIGYLLGWASSLLGMRRLRAAGRGTGALAVLFVQLAGLFLAFLFNVQEMAGSNPGTLFFSITDIAWPASHVFMLVTGALVLRAKVWRGWRVVAPLFCGLALPAFFAIKAFAGMEISGIIFGISTTGAFMLLAYAVRTGEQTSRRALRVCV